jgi:hypothetical protein
MAIACDQKYLHAPPEADRSRWPFDTPILVVELKRRGLTIANAASLASAEIFDATGDRWMNRALRAEAHLRDTVKASEHLLARLRRIEAAIYALASAKPSR